MVSIADWKCHVGFDYHNCFIQVCVLDSQGNELGNRRIENDIDKVCEYVDHVRDHRMIESAGVETCCGASNFAEQLVARGWPIELAHAGICAKMKRSPDKSDCADAFLLADLCRVGYLPTIWLPPKEIRDLRRLGRYRQQLVDHRRDIKLRIRALLREERVEKPAEVGNVWTKSWLAWVQSTEALRDHTRWVMDQLHEDLKQTIQRVRTVEKRMEDATVDDPIVQKLRETKGVGLVTAVVMRAEIGSFSRFHSGKQLARYCALTPKNASSGNRQADGGLIKAGNLTLRTMLIEAGHRLARYQPKWKKMKEDLKKRGKPSSVAVAAIANRWMRKLFWEMKEVEQEPSQTIAA